MKNIRYLLASTASLGQFALIFLLLAGFITWGGYLMLRAVGGPFGSARAHMVLIKIIDNDMRFHINEVVVNEAYYVYAKLYSPDPQEETKDLNKIAEDNAIVDKFVEQLNREMQSRPERYQSDDQEMLLQFIKLRQTHAQTFQQLRAAYEAGDKAQGRRLFIQTQQEMEDLRQILIQWLVQLERERDAAARAFFSDVGFAIQVLVGGLIATLLLALWGYRVIRQVTQPLSSLRDSVTAIGGDAYRPEMLALTRQRRDQAGLLARELERLAQTTEQRDARLKQRIARLQEEVQKSRRRRLKLTAAQPKDAPTGTE